MYILNRGKLDIAANFNLRPQNRKKLLTMEIDPSKEVHFNVFGYSSLISGLKVHLSAIARDYSICFYVDKDTLWSAVQNNSADFEYFHSIKSKVEESRCKEAF